MTSARHFSCIIVAATLSHLEQDCQEDGEQDEKGDEGVLEAVATDVAQHGDPDIHVGRVVGVGDRVVWDDFNKLDHRLSPS